MSDSTPLLLDLDESSTHDGVVQGRVYGTLARGGARQPIEVDPFQVVRVEYGIGDRGPDGDQRTDPLLILRAGDLATLAHRRGLAGDASALVIPGDMRRGGAAGALVKVLPLKPIVDGGVRMAAAAFERHFVGELSRLVACAAPHSVGADDPAVSPKGSGAALVLVHGTAASTVGSFGDLSNADAPSDGLWHRISSRYGPQRTFAFQHRSLTESPIRNAIDLARALQPLQDCDIDLLSQSRGGQVGELLVIGAALKQGEIDRWVDRAWGREPTSWELDALGELRGLCAKLRVRRFVRVSAPVIGSTILSARMDGLLNVLLNLLGSATGMAGRLLFEGFARLVEQIVGTRLDHEVLPGLESQVPGRPISGLLGMGVKGQGELVALAGNARRPGFWGFLKNVVPELFFGGRNDLVVDTDAMVVGARAEGCRAVLQRRSQKGDPIWHLSYFSSMRVRDDLDRALGTGSRTIAELVDGEADRGAGEPGATGEARGPLGYVADTAFGAGVADPGPTDGTRPVVIVAPGIMGSHLDIDGQNVWLDLPRLVAGRFADLDLSANQTVLAPEVFRGAYGRLVRWLSQRCNVRVFPYDWRLSLADSAARLAHLIDAELAAHGRPVRLLAHSMGGLVCRMVLANHKATWDRMVDRDGRLVMLGTPNQGATGIVRLLLGEDPSFRKLAGLDLLHGPKSLLAMIHRMPGAVQMLPRPQPPSHGTKTLDFTNMATWKDIRGSHAGIRVPADGALLKTAKAIHTQLDGAVDGRNMCYVAGRGTDLTPCRVAPEDNGWSIYGTMAGDGTVTWEAGRLAVPGGGEVRRWLADATHGSLADLPSAFPAILELLETGRTDLLPELGSDASRGGENLAILDAPLDESVLPGIAGIDGPEAVTMGWLGSAADRTTWTLKVEIHQGDIVLAAPELPVLVPVFAGARLNQPVLDLDEALDGQVSIRLRTATFSGALGDVDTLSLPPTREGHPPRRAILVGLGDSADGTHASLIEPITRAMVLAAQTWPDPRGAAIRVPPLGSGPRSVDWLDAIVEGAVRAHRVLQDEGLDSAVERIVYVDLNQGEALQLHKCARNMASRPPLPLGANEEIGASDDIVRQRLEVAGIEGFLRAVPAAIVSSSVTPPARRVSNWTIRTSEVGDEQVRFDLAWTTGRAAARLESRMIVRRTVGGMVKALAPSGGMVPDVERFLEGYLLPVDLVRSLMRGQDVQVSVDAAAATIPWEVLLASDIPGGREPGARLGMLRTFLDGRAPTGALAAYGSALVVGPPPIAKMPPLPGAASEAREVAALLAGRYRVDHLASPDATSLRRRFGGSWEILHLAGHGIFDPDREFRSGFVLPGDDVLSALDIRAMADRFPSLVFINACYGAASGALDRPAHAAGLARACVLAGARAVVAAGWAIADGAALAFARNFYAEMLEGTPFGEAVSVARAAASSASSDSTWAAYQCYGDPLFVLPSVGSRLGRRGWSNAGGPAVRNPSGSPRSGEPLAMTNQEVIDRTTELLVLLTRSERGLSGARADRLRGHFESWEAGLPVAVRDSGDVALALARVWLHLGDNDRALASLTRVVDDPLAPIGLFTLKDQLSGMIAQRNKKKAAPREVPRLDSQSAIQMDVAVQADGQSTDRELVLEGVALAGVAYVDPNKDRFGGQATKDGFVLSARVDELEPQRSTSTSSSMDMRLAGVRLRVMGPAHTSGRVAFHLHPTFPPQPPCRLVAGIAELRVIAYGAFVVGAEVHSYGSLEPPVQLELDLSEGKDVPAWFREA